MPETTLTLYDTMAREKRAFVPIDPDHVRVYACGPTVYDFAHIGNARPAIVFDVLFRLLRHRYGEAHAAYVRNITDVDDKINARAAEEGVPIRELTERTLAQYHADLDALGCLRPTHEPRATEHVGAMLDMIGRLIERGHAYEAEGHVLFDVASMPGYGRLSRRTQDELEAGARVEVAPYKRNPSDFVLWKPSKPGEPSWPSSYGDGRPGWHIECSAMSEALLGQTFDIHAGGLDLIFPHHENEIAQSRCAHGSDRMANYWLHNGYLQVEGRKMSKSEGNFTTIRDVLADWPGEVVRLAMLMTHYRQPIDWTVRGLKEAETILDRLARKVKETYAEARTPSRKTVGHLLDDLNTPNAIAHIIGRSRKIVGYYSSPNDPLGLESSYREADADYRLTALRDDRTESINNDLAGSIAADLKLIGIDILQYYGTRFSVVTDVSEIEMWLKLRDEARAQKDFLEADAIRSKLAALGVAIMDGPNGTTWEKAR